LIEGSDYKIISKFTSEAETCTSVQSLFDVMCRTLKHYGIDMIAYSILKSSPDLKKFNVPNLIHSYPQEWIDTYIKNNYFHIDPTIARLFYERDMFMWNNLPQKMNLTEEQIKFMEEAKTNGLKCGATIPFRGPFGELSAIGLASSSLERIPENFIYPISFIAHQFYSILIKLCEDVYKASVKLTPREKEVLNWCLQGKSNTDIAQLLGISGHGVKFHIMNILNKFETNSRTVALVKAIRAGIINPN
jgi:DNA-binding CsgD family transcriptional regulator